MIARGRWILGSGLVLVLAGVLPGCSAIYRNHGYVPASDELAMIEVGRDTRETVGDLIGKPSSEGLLDQGGWYYVGSRWREYAWNPPREVERQVVAISFDPQGRVSNVERFGLDHGQVVPLERRVTDSNIRGVSLLSQLLGNIGNVSTEGLGRDRN